jgi:hypothetical protein
MSFIGRIRTRRWLPRALLALFVLATMETTLLPCAMATQSAGEHCVYCPPGSADEDAPGKVMSRDCAFPDVPTVDVYPASAQHVSMLSQCSFALPETFDLGTLRQTQVFCPIILVSPPEARPLNLKHCVQLK